eukprot:GEMP01091037.1.p1 GENE.GEMP01091037.1~~GEMP01091037.1.p1  ORF type:complete len:121 (+),score=29.83 GEMP01091037.1:167-529(+)
MEALKFLREVFLAFTPKACEQRRQEMAEWQVASEDRLTIVVDEFRPYSLEDSASASAADVRMMGMQHLQKPDIRTPARMLTMDEFELTGRARYSPRLAKFTAPLSINSTNGVPKNCMADR